MNVSWMLPSIGKNDRICSNLEMALWVYKNNQLLYERIEDNNESKSGKLELILEASLKGNVMDENLQDCTF